MKHSLISLVLAMALLTGCASMLEREYQDVSVHPEVPLTAANSSVIQVETYQELVSAVLYFVSQGRERGEIQLINYAQDVNTDLSRACLEVAKDDPLGAYAVDFIKYDYTRIVTTYEANIEIGYRRTTDQVNGLVTVTGSTAIRRELQSTLSEFSTEVALYVGYFNESEDYIQSLVQQAYYDTPTAAMGFPQYDIYLYPDTGSQRIIEILITYPFDEETMLERQTAVSRVSEVITTPFLALDGQENRLHALLGALPTYTHYEETAPTTPWDALVDGAADDEGLALSMVILCDLLDIPCTLMEGTYQGVSHYWNVVVNSDESVCYLDLTREDGSTTFTALELASLGYIWQDGYPVDYTPPQPEIPVPPAPQDVEEEEEPSQNGEETEEESLLEEELPTSDDTTTEEPLLPELDLFEGI